MGFPGGASGEESACSAGDIMRHEFNPWVGKIPWSRAWQSTPLFLLENPMVREDWQVTAHRVAKSQTRLLTARAHTRVLNIGGHIVTGVESVQSLSCVQFFVTPWTTARQASLSINNSKSFLKLMSIKSVMPSNHLILCPPLLLLPSIFPSIRVFSNISGNNCKLF